MNAECAVRTVGFFGPKGEGVYCCTNTEHLSLWHAEGAQRINDFGDVRALARGEPSVDTDGGCGDGTRSNGGGSGGAKEWGAAVDCIVGCQVIIYNARQVWFRRSAGLTKVCYLSEL